jgi:hypothetical protein
MLEIGDKASYATALDGISTIYGDVVEAGGKPSSRALVWWESAAGVVRTGNSSADEQGISSFIRRPAHITCERSLSSFIKLAERLRLKTAFLPRQFAKG